MRAGIPGSGLIGPKSRDDLRAGWTRGGIQLHSRPKEVGEACAVARRNAQAGTPEEAARDANVILLAVHQSRMNDVLRQAGSFVGNLAGQSFAL